MAFEDDIPDMLDVDEFATSVTIEPHDGSASFTVVGILDDEPLWGNEYTGKVNDDVSFFNLKSTDATAINKRDVLVDGTQSYEVISIVSDVDGMTMLPLERRPKQSA